MFHGVRTFKEVIKVKQVFPDAAVVKNLPAMQEMWVRSLGWEDALEEKRATHSCISCLENFRDRGAWLASPPAPCSPYSCKESDMTEHTHTHKVKLGQKGEIQIPIGLVTF